MSENTPPDWVLIEAAKRSEYDDPIEELRSIYSAGLAFRALCDMIERYETAPVDRKLLCAREAMARNCDFPESAASYRNGMWDHAGALKHCMEAIELWESGFGKD